jgi:F420 biosynthesis protein FbiB-like protein
MQTLEAIAQRRSIRKFKDEPLPEETLRQILAAAVQAPSGKNYQPWRFVVVQGKQRKEMVLAMREGIDRLEEQGVNPGSARNSARIMEEAPVTVFVFNPYHRYEDPLDEVGDYLMNLVHVQSVGAAIQNMLLAATELGVGSLWICDVFFAYEELCAWLGSNRELIAAVSLGYADEKPPARPRKSVDRVTRWKGEE